MKPDWKRLNKKVSLKMKHCTKDYASKWDNLLQPSNNISHSPLYRAAEAKIKNADAASKYREISEYANNIMARARQ